MLALELECGGRFVFYGYPDARLERAAEDVLARTRDHRERTDAMVKLVNRCEGVTGFAYLPFKG